MRKQKLLSLTLVFSLLLSSFTLRVTSAQAQGGDGTQPKSIATDATQGKSAYTNQIIVRYKDSAVVDQAQAAATDRMVTLSTAAGVALQYFRPMSGDAHVIRLPQALPADEVAVIARRMAASPEVDYAEPDSRMFPLATPNDPDYGSQWHYSAPVTNSYGANLPTAWDVTTGTITITMAVIDTGILFNHPDLLGRTVPGFDFIADVPTANDGNGRDADASDPGDWELAGECATGSSAQNSSWHGSHVAGTMGANTNNSEGVAGINWNSRILPIRALGKCGGFTSDIVDGIRWAAGLSVSGVPANANPARVINMSLGGDGACGATYQNAINDATNAGAIVVVAAGNSNENAANFSPASCNNVITVASNDRAGNKAWYSNFGSTVEITAPGGETNNGGVTTDGVLSTLNAGTTIPAAHVYVFYQGTSMASPHVAGIVSLMLSVNPTLTLQQVITILQLTATPFPTNSSCIGQCGPGIVNAAGAVNLALNPGAMRSVFLPLVTRASGGTAQIPNGDFESGVTAWTEFSQNGNPLIINTGFPTGVSPHGGSYAVWLGGDINEISYIQQQVTVPPAAPYLYFWNWIGSQETLAGADIAYVRVNGNTVFQIDTMTSTNTFGWVKRVINLGAYSGQSVTLQIRHETDSSLNSNWFIDDVGFQSGP
jgi:serine protease